MILLCITLMVFLLPTQCLAHQDEELFVNEVYKQLECGELNAIRETIADKQLTAQVYELNAAVEFYSGNYRSAGELLTHAKTLFPGTTVYDDTLGYYQKLESLTSGMEELTTTHFIVRLDKRDTVLKLYVVNALESVYKNIGKVFNYYPDDKVLVEFIPEKTEFLLRSTLTEKDVENSGAIAICKFNRLMLCSPRITLTGYRWMDTLAHEYTHMVVNRLSRYNCPLWLHEGIARYTDTLWRSEKSLYFQDAYEDKLAKAVKTGELISFERMAPSLVKLKNQDEVGLAFAEVANAVDYMIKTSTVTGIIGELLLKAKVTGMRAAFPAVLGVTQEGFEAQWVEYLKKTKLQEHPGVAGDKIVFLDTKPGTGEEPENLGGTDVRGHLRLGDKFVLRKLYPAAEQQYRAAEELEPANPVVLLKLAKVLAVNGNLEDAEKRVRFSIERNPNHGGTYVFLGDILFAQKKWSPAAEMYIEALGINPFNPFVHKNLGVCYYSLGNTVSAKNEWGAALELNPDDLEVQAILNRLAKE
ncbi:MAG: tetratricopeptide repeat protein [Elusimicrobiota bacterium]